MNAKHLLLFLLIISGCTTHGENTIISDVNEIPASEFEILNAQVLSAESFSFVKEPDACYYEFNSKEFLNRPAHAHNPLGFLNWIKYLNPLNYFDRNIWCDVYDLLLKQVIIVDEKGEKITLPLVLLRHISHNNPPYAYANNRQLERKLCPKCQWDVITAVVDQRTTNCIESERYLTKSILFYRNTTFKLSEFTHNKKDSDIFVMIGYVDLSIKQTHKQIGGELKPIFDKSGVPQCNKFTGGRWEEVNEPWKSPFSSVQGLLEGSQTLLANPNLKKCDLIY